MKDSSINNIIIYYFSGTGNALSVANWIKEVSTSRGINTQLQDIAKLADRKKVPVPENSLIGFVAPTHGFNFPPVMFHFLLRFPRSKGNNVFIVNTRAGMKAGKLFLPGLSGMAQYFSALLLKAKGYRVIGMRSIDLPSNWISIHPGLKPKVVRSIFQKRKKQTENFSEQILSGKKNYRAIWDIVQDLLITPVAILYYLFGRYVFAKSFVASKKCNNCNLCIKECPVKAIKLIDNRPYWTLKCESCMHCMNRCPQRAIETAHGFMAGLFVIVDVIVLSQLYKISGFDNMVTAMPRILAKTLDILIFTIVLMAALFLSYRILHYLLRFSFVEKMVVYTSLTKYKFWRRYKPPKSKSVNE